MQTVVLASRNKGKIVEFGSLLEPFAINVVGLDSFPEIDEIEETGTTFEENALIKACTASKLTGLIAIADDSGLEVDYLDKAPGVYSARYSQTDTTPATDKGNIRKLLAALDGVPSVKRTGRFRCCLAVCTPAGEQLVVNGAWEGLITGEPMGDNGFGYDPVFYDPTLRCSAAQLSREDKNKCSHRAIAMAKLLEQWPSFIQKINK